MFSRFQTLPKGILSLIFSDFLLQLTNASFMLVLLIYMQKKGIPDFEAAEKISYKFLSGLLIAVPLGIYYRNHIIKRSLLWSSTLFSMTSIMIVLLIYLQQTRFLGALFFLNGVFFNSFQIGIIPYLFRVVSYEKMTESLSLKFTTYGTATIISGFFIYSSSKIFHLPEYEFFLLLLFSCLGLFSFAFLKKIPADNVIWKDKPGMKITGEMIKKISVASFSSLLIAIGAGLTNPFIGLFFYNIHGVNSDQFSLLGSITSLIVTVAFLWVPKLKEQLGYQKAIPLTQRYKKLGST
jgi:hypothetical protein